MRTLSSSLLIAVIITGCNESSTSSTARTRGDTRVASDSSRNPPAPDNTAVNQRDAAANTKTPIDQKENQADVSLTAKIRQQVLEVKDLSIDARNAKIITADGKVTLRGPVKSMEEKETLARIARGVAGEGNVDNQLEVAPSTEVRR